jgi:hypothetical protein
MEAVFILPTTVNGSLCATVLPLADGTALFFRPNTSLSLSSTADGLGLQPLKGRLFDLSLA